MTHRLKIPLRHRVPNPPEHFVGRAAESEHACSLVETGPVVFFRGPPGVGKTALVQHLFSTRWTERLRSTVYFCVAPDEPADQVRVSLALVLSTVVASSVDVAGLRGDPEELVALAIDLAEEHELWVVVDGIHATDATEMRELARQLNAYARRSRWFITGREGGPLPQRRVDVAALPDSDLAELARALGAGHNARAAVAAAAGTPWLLRRYIALGPAGVQEGRRGLLGDVPDKTHVFLEVLAALGQALSGATLGALVEQPAEPELQALVGKGLIEATPTGYGMNPQVRAHLFSPDVFQRRLATLLEALRRSEDPEAVLIALRDDARRGDTKAVSRLLDARGEELFAQGYAPTVWTCISSSGSDELRLWQLRCAAELGNSTVLAGLRQPTLKADPDRLAWATTQYLLGATEEARSLATEICASSDGELRTQALVLKARACLALGDIQGADETLQKAQSPEADALEALVMAISHHADARDFAAQVYARLGAGAEAALLQDLADAFYLLGERRRSVAIVDTILARPGQRASLLAARKALLLRARVKLDAGEPEAAREVLVSVRPFARGLSRLRPEVIELDARLAMLSGTSGVEALLRVGIELAQDSDHQVLARLRSFARALGHRRGEVEEFLIGGVSAADARAIANGVSVARDHLMAGDYASAAEAASAARRLALDAEMPPLEAEALLAIADAHFASASFEALQPTLLGLSSLSESLGAPRLLHHVAWFEGHADAGAMERLAADTAAPVVAARARALLGAENARRDKPVLDVASLSWSECQVRTIGGSVEPWVSTWGLDARNQSVWFADGRSLSLKRKALSWRLLWALSEGHETKDALIREAWGEADYHPLRHDAKVHVAVRAARAFLEKDPARPTRLVTTDDGYHLAGCYRRIEMDG